MFNLLFSALLLCCPQSRAQQQPGPEAAMQAAPALPDKHAPMVMQIIKNLSVLLERRSEIPAERVETLAPELEKFNGKVREALGEKILAEVQAREKAMEDAARADSALKTLQSFRAALQVHYTTSGGKYPETPAALIPQGIPAVPQLYLPEHELTDKVTVIDSKKYDADAQKAVKDSGGWLYFSNPKSENYGLLLLDCSHASPEGAKFYEY